MRSVTHPSPDPRPSSPRHTPLSCRQQKRRRWVIWLHWDPAASTNLGAWLGAGPLSLTNIINTLAPLLPGRELGLWERRCETEAAVISLLHSAVCSGLSFEAGAGRGGLPLWHTLCSPSSSPFTLAAEAGIRPKEWPPSLTAVKHA